MTSVGFTGTRKGMTLNQRLDLIEVLKKAWRVGELNLLHHGDCIGADSEAHDIAMTLDYEVHLHPPKDDRRRAFKNDWLMYTEPKEYHFRNRDIVDCCDLLIAAPDTAHERLRSGTWSTIRYARRIGKTVVILKP